MNSINRKQTMRERVIATLTGEKPDRPPFIDRMDLWYNFHKRAGSLPEEFKEMSLSEIHRAIGFGQEKFTKPYNLKLHGVEIISRFEDEIIYHETDPLMETYFPRVTQLVPTDKPGITVTEFITSIGRLRVQQETLESTIAAGMEPYMAEHPIKEKADYRTVMHIIEHAEFVPRYEDIYQDEIQLGDHGFVVPIIQRIPFQQLLLDYLGEIPLFNAIYECPDLVKDLLTLLDEQLVSFLHKLGECSALYVEFPDNLDGMMTNPNLFAEYSLPYYQRYSEILHNQGKKVGSHTDGNLKPLLSLLAESGLDVCESFSPDPLTECKFEEAWDSWQDGPIIWGGIPSPILEPRISESEFQTYVGRLLETIRDRPIIVGVGDMVVHINLIDRVRYIARKIEGNAG